MRPAMSGKKDVYCLKCAMYRAYADIITLKWRIFQMKKVFAVCIVTIAMFMFAAVAFAKEAEKVKSGEALFKEHCSMCHPDGGNVMNAKKTLRKADRDAHNVKTPADVVKLMRKPGSGMTAFDKNAISDADAKKIAEYIFSTFK
jgi:cytochrome c6